MSGAAADLAAVPDKLYFKIGEVARIVGVPSYVLRYWETEFREISPVKSRSKQRLYRRKDVETILEVKSLLYREGYTIDGARKRVRELSRAQRAPEPQQVSLSFEGGKYGQLLEKIRRELAEISRVMQNK